MLLFSKKTFWILLRNVENRKMALKRNKSAMILLTYWMFAWQNKRILYETSQNQMIVGSDSLFPNYLSINISSFNLMIINNSWKYCSSFYTRNLNYKHFKYETDIVGLKINSSIIIYIKWIGLAWPSWYSHKLTFFLKGKNYFY